MLTLCGRMTAVNDFSVHVDKKKINEFKTSFVCMKEPFPTLVYLRTYFISTPYFSYSLNH